MDVETQLQLLRQIPYFRAVSLDDIAEVVRTLRIRHCQKGEVVFRRGDLCEGLHIVLSGHIRTVIASADGREQVLKVFGPGRTFADISVFDDEPLPADAVAITESSIAVLPRTQVIDLLKRHPDAAIEVIRLFASRLRAYKQLVEDLSLRSVAGRVAKLLIDRASGVETLVEESRSQRLTYTQDEIASMVGSVREVVQRALKAFEHAGLVEIDRGRIQVIDVAALSGWTSDQTLAQPLTPRARELVQP
jgi:CRP/FNR family transcriptional regulator, cyclic AMP receptor protein